MADVAVYRFYKQGFKEHQSSKLKDPTIRGSIMLNVNVNNNKKIGLLHSEKDYTLMPIWFEILSKLDLETESWQVRVDELTTWAIKTFDSNNRFNLDRRLKKMADLGLFEYEKVIITQQITEESPNIEETFSEHSTNIDQTLVKHSPNIEETFSNVIPLETPKNPVAVISTNNKTKLNKTKKNITSRFSSADQEVAEFLFSKIKNLNPEAKDPPWTGWLNDIRLMRERDGRTPEQIMDLFAWANDHEFWKTNILCPGKLREKWTQLSTQRRVNLAKEKPKEVPFWRQVLNAKIVYRIVDDAYTRYRGEELLHRPHSVKREENGYEFFEDGFEVKGSGELIPTNELSLEPIPIQQAL